MRVLLRVAKVIWWLLTILFLLTKSPFLGALTTMTLVPYAYIRIFIYDTEIDNA
jgi:hypothetical protein